MVDVDGAAGELPDHVLRQHLHVAGEHDEIDLLLVDQRSQRRLLLVLRL